VGKNTRLRLGFTAERAHADLNTENPKKMPISRNAKKYVMPVDDLSIRSFDLRLC